MVEKAPSRPDCPFRGTFWADGRTRTSKRTSGQVCYNVRMRDWKKCKHENRYYSRKLEAHICPDCDTMWPTMFSIPKDKKK